MSAKLPLPEEAVAPWDGTGQGRTGGDPAGSAGAELGVGTRSAQQRNGCSVKMLPRPRGGAVPQPRASPARTPRPLGQVFPQRQPGEASEADSLCALREVSRVGVKSLTNHEQVPVTTLLQRSCSDSVPSQLTEKYVSSLRCAVVKLQFEFRIKKGKFILQQNILVLFS